MKLEQDPVRLNRLKRKHEKKARWSNFYRAVEVTNEVLTLPEEAHANKDRKESTDIKVPEPDIDDSKITLSWYDSDLNQYMEVPELNGVVALSEGAFAHAWAGARASHGVSAGRVCYEVRVGSVVTTTESTEKETVSSGLRIGWSTDDSSLHLGEGELSWGYESSGRAVTNCEFKDYGKQLNEKDVVGAYLDLESNPCKISYTLNGEELGTAYEFDKSVLDGKALFPHVLTKNMCYKVNFGYDKYNMLTKTKLVRKRVEIPVEQVLEEKRAIEAELQRQKEEAAQRERERREREKRDREERQRKKRECIIVKNNMEKNTQEVPSNLEDIVGKDFEKSARSSKSPSRSLQGSIDEGSEELDDEKFLDSDTTDSSQWESASESDSSIQEQANDNWNVERPSDPSVPIFTSQEQIRIDDNKKTPFDFFKLFFQDSFLEQIVQSTNTYALQLLAKAKPHDTIREWKPLTVENLKIFLAILFHMGHIKLECFSDYWQENPLFNVFPRRFMSKDVFMIIFKCLRFGSNDVDTLIDYFNNRTMELYNPGEVLLIDEYGSISREGNQIKLFSSHVKVYMLAAPSGIALKVYVHHRTCDHVDRGQDPMLHVVEKLLHNYANKGHHVYMCDHYNSVELSEFLLANGTNSTGMLHAKRKGNPALCATKLKRNASVYGYNPNGVCEREKQDRERKEKEEAERKEKGEEQPGAEGGDQDMRSDKEPAPEAEEAEKAAEETADKPEEPKENGDKVEAQEQPAEVKPEQMETDASEAPALASENPDKDVKEEPEPEGEPAEVTEEQVLQGHVLDKRIKFVIRYTAEEELDGTEVDLVPGYVFINRAALVDGPARPNSIADCEVILMVGMPGSGKTHWAKQHAAAHPDRRYNILSTGALFDRMKRGKYRRKYTAEEELDGTEVDLVPGYVFINRAALVDGPARPNSIADCEVILMVGMPGSGKTHWAKQHAAAHPDRRYNILSTGALFDRMKVDCKPFRASYEARWDAMVSKCAKCVLKLLEIAKGRKRNFILDQTNVYPSAQRRKLREFDGYRRVAVVIVTDDETYRDRQKRREEADGKEVPDGAIVDMKANFSLPDKCSWLDDVLYPELDAEQARLVVEGFHREAKAAGVVRERERRDRSASRDGPPPKRHRSGDKRHPRDDRRRDFNRADSREDRWGGSSSSGGSRWGGGGGTRGSRWGPRDSRPAAPPPPARFDRPWPQGPPPPNRYEPDKRHHQPGGGNNNGGAGSWQRGGQMGGRGAMQPARPGQPPHARPSQPNQKDGPNQNQNQNQQNQQGWNQWAGGWGGWGNWNQNQGWGNWGNWGNWNPQQQAQQGQAGGAAGKPAQQQWPANYTAQQWYQWQQWQQQQQQAGWPGYQQGNQAGNTPEAQQAWAQYYQNYGGANANNASNAVAGNEKK
uniref:B30.2/SPRY domain-containing protein n=1 Tax=Heliothis virescens TaxID=7102 RepID=A0A2A4JU13_HELVI